MDYINKSKDELINEIEKLQQNYNSLKKSIDKQINDQQSIAKMFVEIIDKTPMSIQILDMDGYTIQVNPAFINIFGIKPPSTYSIFKDDQLLKQGFAEVFERIRKGEVFQFPIAYFNTHDINPKYPDNPIWLKAVGFTLNDTNGKPDKIVLTHENITQTKLAEDNLIESKKMLELVMNSIPQFIFWKDCNSVYLGCNENFAHVAGLKSTNEIVGKTDYDLVWKKEESDFFVECDRRVINSGVSEYHIIEPQLQADGKQAWLDTNKVPIFDESGIVIGILGAYEDITKRKQIEQSLKASESLYRKMIENSSLGMHFYTLNNNNQLVFVDANPAASDILGVDNSQFIGKTIGEAFPPLIDTEVPLRYRDAAEKGISWITEQIAYNDGKITGAYDVRAFQTVPGSMVAIFKDITEKKRIEVALQESELQFRNLFESAADAIFIAELETGKIVHANQAAEKLLQLPYNTIIGLNQSQLHPSEVEKYSKATFHKQQKEASDLNHTNIVENIVVRADGTEVPVEILASKVFYKGKKCLMGTFRDVTERKNAELELIKAKEHAEESDRLKTAFLQNMSHEIRTPMNAIMGFSDLLFQNNIDKIKIQKFSEIISLRCNDLLDIINDILDISKIESGQLPINIEPCNLNDLFIELSSFFTEYQKRIGKQQIKFSFQSLCVGLDNTILTDRVKLKQIFINLISNAFKFTDEGKIESGCKFDKNHNLLFFVTDTGIGIPSDKHEAVFERFYQLHQGAKKNIGGTGLGLPIVKALVGLLGGEIFLESEPKKGSSFSFTIPYKTIEQGHIEQVLIEKHTSNKFIGKTILIVEDDLYNAEYIKEVLSYYSLNILQVEYGKQAVEISLSQHIDLILMDIRLPDISGYEATQQIMHQKPHLKIIAQTAYAAQDEKRKAIEAGCIDYISKPTKKEVLLSMLNKYLL